MDLHVRALGLAYIIYGVLSAAISLTVLISLGGPASAWTWAGASEGLGLVFVIFLFSHIALAVPMIVGGIFVRRLHEWARMLLIAVSALNILNVPIGSVLGGYGLWVLFQPETEPLFSDPLFRRGRSGRSGPALQAERDPRRSRSAKPIPSPIKSATTNLPE